MKKPVITVIATAIALLVVAILVVPSLIDLNRYRGRIQAELEKALGRPVTFSQIHASLTPPSVRLDDFSIGEDPRFGAGPFASGQTVRVVLKLWPLIHKKVDIRSLRLENPRVQLIADRAGVWNFSSLGRGQPRQEKTKTQYELAEVRISDGQIRLVDQQKGINAVYDHIDLAVRNFAPGQPFEIDAALHLPGKGSEQLEARGTAGPLPEAGGLVPFTGKINLTQVSLGDLQKLPGVPAFQGTDGIASGSVELRSQHPTITSSGSLKLDQPRIRGVDIGYPISLDYKLAQNTATGVLEIQSGTIHLGTAPLSIAGTVETKPTPQRMDLKVSTSNASIAEAARLASALGVVFNSSTRVTGTLSASIHVQGAVTGPAVDGNLTASNIAISGGSVKQPVQVPVLELALSPSVIRSDPFTAHSGGTTLEAQFTLSNYSGASPEVQASLRTARARLDELLSMARAYGFSSANGFDGSGALTLDLMASGPLKNTSAMTFSGNGELQAAALKVPSLAQPLKVHNAAIRFSQNSVTLENLSASFDQTSATGSVTIRDFAAPRVQLTLAADKVDLISLQRSLGGQPAAGGQPPQKSAANHALEFVPAAHAAAARAPAGPLENVTGSGSVNIGTLTYDQLVMTNVRSQLVLDHGIVRLAPLAGELYGGQQTGQIALDTRVVPMAVSVSTRLERVDANQLLSSVSNLKQTLYGLLAANANTQFRAQSAADIARTLNGTISLNLTSGRIAQMDILNQLASIGRFVSGALPVPKPYTDVVKLNGSLQVTNGLAQTNNLQVEIPGAALAAQGSVNLATEALNMRVTAVLSRELSEKVGGTQVGGFMQTALSNSKGELVLPVLVSGTFSSPRFAPDFEQVARLKLQNLLPSFNNPAELTSSLFGSALGGLPVGAPRGLGGILGPLTGQTPEQQPQAAQPPVPNQQPQPSQAQPQQNPLNDLLGNILGGRKKKNQPQQQPPPPQQQPKP